MKKIVAAVLLAGSSFAAQALEVRPLVATFPMAHKSSTLTVYNTDGVEKTYQVFVDKLTLVDGKQVRTSTKEIRFAPSVMTIPPKSAQTVRYVRSGDTASKEVAYRIRVEEIPSEIKPTQSGVVYAMRMDFPWTWRANGAEPKLSLSWKDDGVEVHNSGTATAQIANFSIAKGLLGYVMPGETAHFKVKAPKSRNVQVLVNGKQVDLDVQ